MTLFTDMNLTAVSGSNGVVILNEDLSKISSHDHDGDGNGVKLTQRAINFDDEVFFNGHRIANLNSSDYITVSSPLSGANKQYFVSSSNGSDFWVNDGNGNQIQMSVNGFPVTGSVDSSVILTLLNATNIWSGAQNTFTNKVLVSGVMTGSNVRFTGQLDVVGAAHIQGNLISSGNVVLGNSAADQTTVTGILNVGARANFAGDSFFTGSATLMGPTTTITSTNLNVTSDTSFTGFTSFTGSTVTSGLTQLGASGLSSTTDNVLIAKRALVTQGLSVTGSFVQSGSNLNVFNGRVDFNEEVDFNAAVTFPAGIAGQVTFGSNVFIDDFLTVEDDLVVSGSTTTQYVLETDPAKLLKIKEDFAAGSGAHDASLNRIYAENTWNCTEVNSPVITITGGSAKNPGRLNFSFGNTGTDDEAFFQLGHESGTGGYPLDFSTIAEMEMVMMITDNAANNNPTFRGGLVDDNSVTSGGVDALYIGYAQGVSANWQLVIRKASTDVRTSLIPWVNAEFIMCKFSKQTNGDWLLFVNDSATPTVTILAASLPTGTCTFGGYAVHGSTDTIAAAISYDFMSVTSLIPTRHGA